MRIRIAGLDEADAGRTFLAMILILTFVMNTIGRGVTEAFAVFLLPVQDGLGVTRSEITLTYSIYMLANGCTAPFAGQLIDRLGARITYGIGVLSLGARLFSRGLRDAHLALLHLRRLARRHRRRVTRHGCRVEPLEPLVRQSHRLGHVAAVRGGRRGNDRHTAARPAPHRMVRLAHAPSDSSAPACSRSFPFVMMLPLGRITMGSTAWRERRAAPSGRRTAQSVAALGGGAHERVLGPVRGVPLHLDLGICGAAPIGRRVDRERVRAAACRRRLRHDGPALDARHPRHRLDVRPLRPPHHGDAHRIS